MPAPHHDAEDDGHDHDGDQHYDELDDVRLTVDNVELCIGDDARGVGSLQVSTAAVRWQPAGGGCVVDSRRVSLPPRAAV